MPVLVRVRFQFDLQNYVLHPVGYLPFHEAGCYLHYLLDTAPTSYVTLSQAMGTVWWPLMFWQLGGSVRLRWVSSGVEDGSPMPTDYPDGKYWSVGGEWFKSAAQPHYPGVVLNFTRFTATAGRRGRGRFSLPYIMPGATGGPSSHFGYRINHSNPQIIAMRNGLASDIVLPTGNVCHPVVYSRADGVSRLVTHAMEGDYLSFHDKSLKDFHP